MYVWSFGVVRAFLVIVVHGGHAYVQCRVFVISVAVLLAWWVILPVRFVREVAVVVK